MRLVHRLREKHFNADGLSKKTESYEEKEKYDETKPSVAPGFGFGDQASYDVVATVLDKVGCEKPEEAQDG